eukprot:2789045-Amphidinium_carterae.2
MDACLLSACVDVKNLMEIQTQVCQIRAFAPCGHVALRTFEVLISPSMLLLPMITVHDVACEAVARVAWLASDLSKDNVCEALRCTAIPWSSCQGCTFG